MQEIGLGKGLLKQLAMQDRLCRGLVDGPSRWTTGAWTMPEPWVPIADSKMLKAVPQARARQSLITSLSDSSWVCSLRNLKMQPNIHWCIAHAAMKVSSGWAVLSLNGIDNKSIRSHARSLGILRPMKGR